MNTCSRLARSFAMGGLVFIVAGTIPALVSTGAEAATTQSGVTALTAPIVQPGTAVAASSKARLTGTVKFQPVRKGRPVVIQRRVGTGSWATVTKKRENGTGTVSFTGPAHTSGGSPYAYRGVAVRWGALSRVASSAQTASVWAPKLTDEFSFFDSKKWSDRVTNAPSRPCADVGNSAARQVTGGELLLKVRPDPERIGQKCVTPDGTFNYYLNGQVGTQNTYSFNKGMFAARIKFPRDRGQHGSFWLQALNPQYLEGKPGQSGAEIDTVEFFGKGYPDGGLASFLYNYGINGGKDKIGGVWPRATAMLPSGDTWWTSYHVFSLEWTSGAYIFRVDGREHFRTSRGVSNVPEYLILSLLTSNWELKQAKSLGITPNGTMHVDWAQVWQRQ